MGFLTDIFKKSRTKVDATRDNLRHALARPLHQLRTTGNIHDADYSTTGEAFAAYHKACCDLHDTDNNTDFKEDALDYFVHALQLAAMRHEDHTAWPVMSTIRKQLAVPVRQRLATDKDPWLRVAGTSIGGATGDVALGKACLDELATLPELRAVALYFLWTATMAFPKYNSLKTVDELLRSAGATAPWTAVSPLPTSRRWVLATGGHPVAPEPLVNLAEEGPRASIRLQLRGAWNITNAESAAETTGKLMSGDVHSIVVAAILSGKLKEKVPGQHLVEADPTRYGKNCVVAYDIGRGVSVTRSCVAAGYLTEAEGLERIDHAASSLVGIYKGWDDYCFDYQLGRRFQNERKDPEDPYHLFMEWQRTDPRSPWRELAFGAR